MRLSLDLLGTIEPVTNEGDRRRIGARVQEQVHNVVDGCAPITDAGRREVVVVEQAELG